jgi:hypothetical protein
VNARCGRPGRSRAPSFLLPAHLHATRELIAGRASWSICISTLLGDAQRPLGGLRSIRCVQSHLQLSRTAGLASPLTGAQTAPMGRRRTHSGSLRTIRKCCPVSGSSSVSVRRKRSESNSRSLPLRNDFIVDWPGLRQVPLAALGKTKSDHELARERDDAPDSTSATRRKRHNSDASRSTSSRSTAVSAL